jgi:ABC-2 type transport system permease protein
MLAPFVFLFLIPAITMRSFADERSYGTIETLFTNPLTDLQIILAKYFAAVLLVAFSLLPTLIYYLTVYHLGLPKGNLDSGAIWGSYIGLLFLGASFAAIGIFASSLTDNQIVAFIAGAGIAAFVYLGFEVIYSLSFFGKADLFIKSLGISSHYASMSRGVIDTRDVIYFLSVIAFFILLTHFVLGRRKWK